MIKEFNSKIKEAFWSVMPIVLLVMLLTIWVAPVEPKFYITFGVSSIFLIVGMALFNVGADQSMIEIGASIGSTISKTKKLKIMIFCTFLIGFLITLAEPELLVISEQVGMGKWLFVMTVSLGVGVFLALSIIRTVFRVNLSFIFAVCYALILVIAFFVQPEYLPIMFDAGSVTTSSISVPFLLSFGIGLASLRVSKNSEDDTFGLIALSSVGPIFSVMIVSLFLPSGLGGSKVSTLLDQNLWQALISSTKEVAFSLSPIIIIFFIFQITLIKLPMRKIIKICVGLVYTFVGIVMFLTGVAAGFLPVAYNLGIAIHESTIFGYKGLHLLIPLNLLLGLVMISAEPAVHVLKRQVEEITNGKIKQNAMLITLSIGTAFSVLLATLRIVFDIPILVIMIVIYVPCIVLAFINPKVFTAIAFDSGGISTGSMGVSFVLPMLTGVSGGGGNAFGTIGIMAGVAVLAIQIIGLIYTIKLKKIEVAERKKRIKQITIIEYDIL